MPAVLTHKGITLLARDRLKRLHDTLSRSNDRKRLRGDDVSDLEEKLERLALQAIDIMSAPPLADARSIAQRQQFTGRAPDLFQSVSKFAVMGSMGPDLPAFAHLFQPGQGWVFDTVHKGTPDYNREAVIARTTDLALSFHRKAKAKVETTFRNSDPVKQEEDIRREMRKVRAYVMGHLCHVAGDVITHPFINDLEWHAGISGSDHIAHGDNEKVIDADVAKKVFRRGKLKGYQGWAEWWPEENEVEDYFFEAWVEAFQDVYGTERPRSFKDFEDELERFEAPDLTPEFMKDGYGTFRGFVLNFAYNWSWPEWFGALTPAMAPLVFAPLIGQGLPHGRELFGAEDSDFDLSERATFELLTLSLGAGGLTALILSSLLMPFARRGAADLGVYAIVAHSYAVASWLTGLIEGIAVKETEGEGIPDGARWAFFFVLPIILNVVLIGPLIADAAANYTHARPFQEKPKKRRLLLSLPLVLPLVVLLLIGILVGIFVARRKTDDTRIGDAGFLVVMAIWMAVMIGAWFGFAFLFNSEKMGSLPETADGDELPLRKHAVSLFDDQSLFEDPASEDTVKPRYFSSDLRPIARLWWEGDGDMTIRSDRYGLTFQHSAGGAEAQTVPGPMVPMTVAQYLALLEELVADGAGTTGGLKGAVFDAEDIAAYPLPTGAVFAGHGDFEEGASEEDINEGLAEFRPLTTTNSDDAYMLFHAPKPFQAIHMTPTGPFVGDDEATRREIGHERGYRYVVDLTSEDADTSPALMAQAADLAALLCLGAAGQMQEPVVDSDQIFQVFRNWSLDRRRINEWRMLVAGKGRSDKPAGAAAAYDPAMPQGDLAPEVGVELWRAPLDFATDDDALPMGEGAARGFGWIPTLREFSRLVAEDLDLASTDTDPVRPDVPTPQAIARAMAWIVDAPDPMET